MVDFFDDPNNYLSSPDKRRPTPEHNFSVNFFEWENNVVKNAVEFFTLRFLGQGKRERREFTTLSAAIEDAKNDLQCTVNALTESERSVCIERKDWNKYLTMLGEDNVI